MRKIITSMLFAIMLACVAIVPASAAPKTNVQCALTVWQPTQYNHQVWTVKASFFCSGPINPSPMTVTLQSLNPWWRDVASITQNVNGSPVTLYLNYPFFYGCVRGKSTAVGITVYSDQYCFN